MSDTPIQIRAKKANPYWGRRGGGCSQRIAAKTSWPMGCFFRQKKWASNYNGRSGGESRHYTAILAANAMRYGFLNGKRIGKKVQRAAI